MFHARRRSDLLLAMTAADGSGKQEREGGHTSLLTLLRRIPNEGARPGPVRETGKDLKTDIEEFSRFLLPPFILYHWFPG